MNATAILPVKRFAAAKQRLAPGMGSTHRAELAAAMLEDVLEAIGEARSIERTIVVSSEPRAVEIAGASGAELVTDPDEGGHSGAGLAGIARADSSAPSGSFCCRSTARCWHRGSWNAC